MSLVVSGPTPTRAQLLTLLRGFLTQILPAGVEVVIGQANRVPEITSADFVVMTLIGVKRLAGSIETWSSTPGATTINREQDTGAEVQLDIHGPGSMDNADLIKLLLRSGLAFDFFGNSGIEPLYVGDGFQMPFIAGEDQYEDRWVLKPMFQMNVNVATTQQFAGSLTPGLREIDTSFPPGH